MKLIIADKQEDGEGRELVQDVWLNAVNSDGERLLPNEEGEFKDFFNKQFSKPVPVQCKMCTGTGCITRCFKTIDGDHEYRPDTCDRCNGDRIQGYQYYVYDKDWYFTDDISWDVIVAESKYHYKDRPLEIIVNPFVEVQEQEKK